MAAPSGKPKAVYVPCAFTGAPPAPLPQASGPLPAEKQREQELARKQKVADKQRKYDQKVNDQKNKGSIFGSIAAGVIQAAAVTESAFDKAYDGVNNEINTKTDEASLNRFRKLGYPLSEALLMDFHCSVVSGSFFAEGYLFISTHYITFDGTVKPLYTASKQEEILAFALALSSVVSIQPAIAMRSVEKGRPPQLQPTQDLGVADSVMVYTKEGHVHQFYEMWVVIDHAWRAQVQGV